MAREYILAPKRVTRYNTSPSLKNGLKQVHIGEDVWLFGRQKFLKDGRLHCVVYGPDRKAEYHLYDEDVTKLFSRDDDYGNNGGVYRDGNEALEPKVKIHILTHILDDKNNWCFDLEKVPSIGKLKVIYDNGTVKNINFTGLYESIEIKNTKFNYIKGTINPIGYRING